MAEVAAPAILRPGVNCWRIERTPRFYCIQDAADYFRLVRQAMLRAKHSIFTLGWDTAAAADLLPGDRNHRQLRVVGITVGRHRVVGPTDVETGNPSSNYDAPIRVRQAQNPINGVLEGRRAPLYGAPL